MILEEGFRNALVVSVLDLGKDMDCPVYVDGDLVNGMDIADMDPIDAARIVIDTILDHPIVKEVFDDRERLWEALRWSTTVHGPDEVPPRETSDAISFALMAAKFESE